MYQDRNSRRILLRGVRENRKDQQQRADTAARVVAIVSRNLNLFPEIPGDGVMMWWSQWSEGGEFCINAPYDANLVDSIILKFIKAGWEMFSEMDQTEHLKQRVFQLRHPVLEQYDVSVRTRVYMDAGLSGSKCTVEVVGTETREVKLFKVVCNADDLAEQQEEKAI